MLEKLGKGNKEETEREKEERGEGKGRMTGKEILVVVKRKRKAISGRWKLLQALDDI